eukprot:Blabericola_migrator_1__1374@NODE_1357_length_4726_cov_203_531015_g911_i0_p3_GENE_NODE_1357_length_4726_cov_203_531015_g911_i0NODE_1357_length_4726_cov_203_531015_g911_i0_p3_ORF_typecomplete_len182_score43_03_NODE_1357_length_4726_cov_203_531015_g911_i010191564
MDIDSSDDSGSSGSSTIEGVQTDENGDNFVYTCPISGLEFASKLELNGHLHSLYKIESLESLVMKQGPPALGNDKDAQSCFLYYCILVNYLRSKKLSPSDWASELAAISPSSSFWGDDSYLIPSIPDDPLIRAYDGWWNEEDSEEERPVNRRFVIQGETMPSQEFLTQQAEGLRELGAFDD